MYMYISLTLSIPSWAWLKYRNIPCFRHLNCASTGLYRTVRSLRGSSHSLPLSLSLTLSAKIWQCTTWGSWSLDKLFLFPYSLFFCFAVQLLIETPESILCPAQPRRALTLFFWHPTFGRGIRTLLSAMQSLNTVAKVWELNNRLSYIDDIWR